MQDLDTRLISHEATFVVREIRKDEQGSSSMEYRVERVEINAKNSDDAISRSMRYKHEEIEKNGVVARLLMVSPEFGLEVPKYQPF